MGSGQSTRQMPPQGLDLSPAPSSAEQSLLAHGLSLVYDPNQEEQEEVKTVKAGDAQPASSRAVVALTATPSEVLDNRSVLLWFHLSSQSESLGAGGDYGLAGVGLHANGCVLEESKGKSDVLRSLT